MADEGVRRRRKDAANCAVGVREVDGRWELPGVDLDAYLVMRMIRPEHRLGFRVWILERDEGRLRRRALAEWDRMYAAYQAA